MNRLRTWLCTQSTFRDVSFLTIAVTVLYLLTGDHPAFGSASRYTESCREMVDDDGSDLGKFIFGSAMREKPNRGIAPH